MACLACGLARLQTAAVRCRNVSPVPRAPTECIMIFVFFVFPFPAGLLVLRPKHLSGIGVVFLARLCRALVFFLKNCWNTLNVLGCGGCDGSVRYAHVHALLPVKVLY